MAMSMLHPSPISLNPFTLPTFWGRESEIRMIYKRLLSQPPQCSAIVGETNIGKTTLLRQFINMPNTFITRDLSEDTLTFIYLDCNLYIDLTIGDQASVLFWKNLYRAAHARLLPNQPYALAEPVASSEQHPIDTALEVKFALEELIREHSHPVIFLLDNFEGVARLPLRDSEWLRSMILLNCAYIVSSRHLLYLLYQYHPQSWAQPSPLWNLFSDPIYLGLLPEQAVEEYLTQASEKASDLGSCWEKHDIEFIRKTAGRHPELIRIACMHLFRYRLQSDRSQKYEKNEQEEKFLELSIYRDAGAICNQLWHGLADPELSDEPSVSEGLEDINPGLLSTYQKGLITIAKGYHTPDSQLLFILDQRGLIERVNEDWHVFAEVMRQFVLKQDQIDRTTHSRDNQQRNESAASQTPSIHVRREVPTFTNRERKVYEYLKAHLSTVCERGDIKAAIWESTEAKDSALQKIIERLRDKIEDDPKNPRYLIAVRGQGYILRRDPLSTSAGS